MIVGTSVDVTKDPTRAREIPTNPQPI